MLYDAGTLYLALTVTVIGFLKWNMIQRQRTNSGELQPFIDAVSHNIFVLINQMSSRLH